MILVFFGLSSSPMPFNHSSTRSLAFSTPFEVGWSTTKSSAYRIRAGFPSFLVYACCSVFSIPSSAMFARSGEMTPPCGVPSSEGVKSHPVNIPALSQARMDRLIAG